MGRKKKVEEVKFEPSKYQLDIYNHIEHGVGNLVIEAAAGSGKTTTIVNAIKLINDEKRILFCAFNKDIVGELKKKIVGRNNVDIRTVHSLGYLMIMRNLHAQNLQINDLKYRSFVMQNIKSLSTIDYSSFSRKMFLRYINNICKLIDFCRYNLADTEEEAEKLAERHEVEIIGDEISIALKCMEWGKMKIEEVDYTDMVWLPNVLYMKPIGFQYDFIFGDEAQDFSVAQRELLLKCQKMGTRYIFTGDPSQAIYSFASASPESFKKLKEIPNTISLPLSISYRCAKNIVKFAKEIVPSIEENNDGRDGEILFDVKLSDVKDGDMILCRNNAPLMKIYNDFISMGKQCFIRGKDIGLNLVNMIEETGQSSLSIDLHRDGVFPRLYKSLFDLRNSIMESQMVDELTATISPIVSSKLDMISALEVLSFGVKNSKELIDKVKKTFSDKEKVGISLSTIHKAKGLEADNVYIACRSLMPSRSAKKDWEREQEMNLIYVAYTRAKNRLGFIDEGDFKAFTNDNAVNTLKSIEEKISSLYGFKRIVKATKGNAKMIIKNASKIEKNKKGSSAVLGSCKTKKKTLTNIVINKRLKK